MAFVRFELSAAASLNQVRGDAGCADWVSRIPSNQEVALPADDLFHTRGIPDARIIVGSLPVGNNVQDAALIITHNLDVDGVSHLSVPEVLGDGVWRNNPRRIFKLDNGAVHTEGEARQLVPVQQALRSCSTFSIRRHPNVLRLQDRDSTGDPAHRPPGRLLAHPPTEAGNAR